MITTWALADPAIRKNAKEWFTRLFDVMAQLDIHLIGGALYSLLAAGLFCRA